jgi:hypothetical protein
VDFQRGELLIYHWGHNRKDDGGDVIAPQPDGSGYYPSNSKDWGIRILE